MMGRVSTTLLCVCVVAGASSAHAERLALVDVHAEADQADEASAVTLLVRSALAGRTLVDPPDALGVETPSSVLAARGANHAAMIELTRDGLGLAATLVVIGDPAPVVATIRAGDGDVRRLANGIVDQLTATLHLEPTRVPDGSLGQLRPFTIALRLRASDPTAAASALADASPRTLLVVPAAAERLRGLPAAVTDRALSVIAARAIGDRSQLDAIGTGTDGIAAAARAFAAIDRIELRAADQALDTRARDGVVAAARAALAEPRGDDRELAERLAAGLATDQRRAVLALSSTVAGARLGAPVHRSLVELAANQTSTGVAARIGLNAAEADVEPARALDLVSVRELDDTELERLERTLGKATEATAARLRAELAMRRAEPGAAHAILEFVRVAPNDPRAHRYHGWLLSSERRPSEAAAAFGRAGQHAEQARALAAAGQLDAALVAVGGAPSSPEELAIAARAAIAAKQPGVATELLARAVRVAPANPQVHAVLLELGGQDPARLTASKVIVERALGVAIKPVAPVQLGGSVAVRTKSIGGAGSATPVAVSMAAAAAADVQSIAPMIEALPELRQLESRRLVLVERRWAPPWSSFRATTAQPLAAALAQLLSGPPYHAQVAVEPTPVDTVDPTMLAALTADADAVVVYHAEPAGGRDADVSVLLYLKGATEAKQVDRTLAIPGLVGWNTHKITLVAGIAATLLLGSLLWLLRAKGRITIVVDRAPDVTDEVLCVELTDQKARPPITDLAAFCAATKKAGTTTRARSATLIPSGMTFVVPAGDWYVHLYGGFMRANQLRPVPETCTQRVTIKRGDRVKLDFDLTAKLAELTLAIEAEQRRGVVIWANANLHQKVYTSDAGEARLMLPVGTHTIHVDAHGQTFDRIVQIVSFKAQRMSLNVTRELRLNGIALDLAPMAEHELELSPQRPPPARAAPPAEEARSARIDPSGPATTPERSYVEIGSNPRAAAAAATVAMPDTGAVAAPGDRLLGRYRIDGELGRGAMGVVRRAFDEKLERPVAIKEIADDLQSNPMALQLFMQEAKALAQLNHTNIVAMYDQVSHAGKLYMIMEFVDGTPLEALVEARGVLPWPEAVGIVDQVCAGLAYAHARKVIHRDIKPANIFVTRDQVAKLGDFGLARVMREMVIRRTEIRGTPLYMAPEQITGTNVNHRADLYAIGCTLFELVSGRPPFIDGDILYAQMHAPPPAPSSLCPDLPPGLDALILSLIAKHADERPSSADEVRAAFREL